MKELIELRVNYDYAHLLFNENEGKNINGSVKIIELLKDDPRYNEIAFLAEKLKTEGKSLFFGWKIKRTYSKQEINRAKLFYVKMRSVFEPSGEECGTLY